MAAATESAVRQEPVGAGLLEVTVLECANLPRPPTANGLADVYVSMHSDSQKEKTVVAKVGV